MAHADDVTKYFGNTAYYEGVLCEAGYLAKRLSRIIFQNILEFVPDMKSKTAGTHMFDGSTMAGPALRGRWSVSPEGQEWNLFVVCCD